MLVKLQDNVTQMPHFRNQVIGLTVISACEQGLIIRAIMFSEPALLVLRGAEIEQRGS
jgi:hypothetical protein